MAKINLKVKSVGQFTGLEKFIKSVEISFSDQVLSRDLERIRKRTVDVGINTIESKRKRNLKRHEDGEYLTQLNNLANTLKVSAWIEQTRNNRFRLVIGNHEFLNKHAKYWYVVNYGHKWQSSEPYKPPARFGYFGDNNPPFINVGNEVFHLWKKGSGKPSFKMTPKKSITPIYYLQQMEIAFKEELEKLKEEYREKARKILRKAKEETPKINTLTETQIELLESKGYDLAKLSVNNALAILRNISK